MKSIKFIQEIANALGIKKVVSEFKGRGIKFIMISENGLSVISKDNAVLASYQSPDGETYSNMAVVSDELKTLIINAYKSGRIEIEEYHNQRRLKQMNNISGV